MLHVIETLVQAFLLLMCVCAENQNFWSTSKIHLITPFGLKLNSLMMVPKVGLKMTLIEQKWKKKVTN